MVKENIVTENNSTIIHQLQIDANKTQKGDSQDKIDFSTLILKKIPGYSWYLASNQGFIIRTSGKRKIPIRPNYGCPSKSDRYMRLRVYSDIRKGYKMEYIHRLIALAFHEIPSNDSTDVHHIDGNPRNNRPENLMWCSHQYNCQQRQHTGRQGKAIQQIDLQTNKVIAQWISVAAAARSVGKGSSHALGNALLRNGGSCVLYGYMWRYSDEESTVLAQ